MPKSQKNNVSTPTKPTGEVHDDAPHTGRPKDGPGSGHNDGFANHAIEQNKNTPSRGSSIQGPGRNAKGGPAGANWGGAPRAPHSGSRVEPSHQQRAAKKDRGNK